MRSASTSRHILRTIRLVSRSDEMTQALKFEFATAGKILFGPGAVGQIGGLASALGVRALLVTGRTLSRADSVRSALEKSGLKVSVFSVPGEPTVESVTEGIEQARHESCDIVIGCGGGSVLDTAKAIAVLLANGGTPLDYIEVVGRGRPFTKPAVPCIAVPTTAGSGAEVTRNAVLTVRAHKIKASLRSEFLLPRAAIVDPELTCDLPRSLTATTGLDTLTQLIEPYVCVRANPLTDGFCVTGLRLVGRSLRRACDNGRDIDARQGMSLASTCSGLALANAGLGAVHGLAAAIGGAFEAPHGAVCAALLPVVIDVNLRALRSRAPHSPAIVRYQEIAELLTGRPGAPPEEAIEWIRQFCRDFAVPGLAAFGLTKAEIPDLVAKAAKASSIKANPVALFPEELQEILTRAL